jgi:hypothetical protein
MGRVLAAGGSGGLGPLGRVLAVSGRGLGPQVEFGAVLLEPAPNDEATESDDSENKQLLHGGVPFTSTVQSSPGLFGSGDAPPRLSAA